MCSDMICAQPSCLPIWMLSLHPVLMTSVWELGLALQVRLSVSFNACTLSVYHLHMRVHGGHAVLVHIVHVM